MRFVLSWVLYFLGESVWFFEKNILGHFRFTSVYRLYNWLMVTSADVQGDTTYGPWTAA